MNFSGNTLKFPSPEPPGKRPRIYPVFLPFSGCKVRCVFCAQDVQTGKSLPPAACGGQSPVGAALAQAGEGLAAHEQKGGPSLELAFYGGTFSALAGDDLEACLAFAAHWRQKGLVSGVRCSTRPDAVLAGEATRLRDAGVDLVELGVQSFCESALGASLRGYSGETARLACETVQNAGLALGIQLMPGMPGLDGQNARKDVALAASFAPACVRLYPCLVLEGTALAAMWRRGEFSPWDFENTADFLAEACLAFWEKNVPVIRIGLAEEPGLCEHVLAGPRHPSLGDMVRGRALHAFIRQQVMNAPRFCGAAKLWLKAPRSAQGCFWGHKGELAPAYAQLGIHKTRVQWHDESLFVLSDDCDQG